MTSLKSLALDWFPPVIAQWLRVQRGAGNCFNGEFATWEEAASKCTGYAAQDILDKVLRATLKVKTGEAAFERDSVVFEKTEYSWPVLAGLMYAAARNGGRLNVLDFGGALGSSYFQNTKFLHRLPEVRWNVVEQAHFVEIGWKHIQDEQLRFYKTIEDCLGATQPNVILLSSVLQYLKSPTDIIQSISSAGATCLILDRTPFSVEGNDKILIQRVPPTIYEASYPMWVFSYQEFINRLEIEWSLVASNLCSEGFVKSENGLEFAFQGIVFESRRC